MDTLTNICEIYSLKSQKWMEGPDLPEATAYAQMIAVEGVIYHIGGKNKTTAFSNIYRLEKVNSSMRRWSKIGQLAEKRAYLGVVPIRVSLKDCNFSWFNN